MDADGTSKERIWDIAVAGGREIRPDGRAFYHVRALEIPTPRWTTYDAVRFGLPLPPEVPPFVQDRAYSSPVWYTPGSWRAQAQGDASGAYAHSGSAFPAIFRAAVSCYRAALGDPRCQCSTAFASTAARSS